MVILAPEPGATLAGPVTLFAVAAHPSGVVDGVAFHWQDLGAGACVDPESKPSGSVFGCVADAGLVAPARTWWGRRPPRGAQASPRTRSR